MRSEPQEHPDITRMKRRLHTRVRRRQYEGGWHYYLNLRAKGLRGGRVALRDPRSPGWPDRGRVARTEDQALEWSDAYVDRLGLDWCRGVERLQTPADHAKRYLENLAEVKGEDSSSYRNTHSHLHNHLLPALGEGSLRAVGADQVQAIIDNLKTVDGRPAGTSLKDGVLATLSNLWRSAHPEYPVPWRGRIKINREDPGRARRERAKQGIRHSRRTVASICDELRRILLAAVVVDILGARNRRKRRGINNHADVVAFLIHHMVRVEETTFIRGFDIDHEIDAILIPGTKSSASEERLVPTQRAYLPWLERLMASLEDEESFLFPTSDPRRLPAVDTTKGKVGRVLEAAGLKRPGELTHHIRAAHTSIAVARGVPGTIIAALSGRRISGDAELTDHYLRWREFITGLPPEMFNYFPVIAAPEELMDEARAALRAGRIKV